MTAENSERRVLIVDDEQDFAETLEDILQSKGYQVTSAHSPEDAVRQVHAVAPQVALLDIRLGLSSGLDLLSALRAEAPNLIVVMMTAYADVETAVQAVASGASYYLRKPIDPRDLLATLERCFERVRLEAEKAAAEAALRARNLELAEVNSRLEQQVVLEARLAQAQKMESIGRLAGGVAHDFNNILTAIVGFVALLERASLEPQLQRYVRGIGDAAWRATDLTKQILAFSRQGSSGREPVQVGPVVKEALKLMRAALPTTIEIREAGACELSVAGNATQLHQVVVNLCTNAGYAMREAGGILDVAVAEVDVGVSMIDVCPPLVVGRHVCLSVKDTGCGITAQELPRIFDPFYTTRNDGAGTGMGLAVVHGIVKEHGGTISVKSSPGAGSTFSILLPAIQASPAPTRGALPEASGDERVLFVDDEEVQVEIARKTLASLGYRVAGAGSAAEALALVRADPAAFDVVVTDTTMPGMPGDVLASELLAIRSDLPVILCTGFSERATEARLRTVGIRELLMKPYSLTDLSQAIRRALKRAPASGPDAG